MFIELACPACGHNYRFAREHLGKKGKCQCGHVLLIEEPPEDVVEVIPEAEPVVAPVIVTEPPRRPAKKPKSPWDAVRDVGRRAGEAAARSEANHQVVYFGGPFDLKAKTDGILSLTPDELVFKSSVLRREFFRISYASITGAHVDTAERLGKLRTLGTWALAGPLAAVFVGFGVKKKEKFLKLDFQDDTGLAVAVVFGKSSFGPDMDKLSGKILAQRREAMSTSTETTSPGTPPESSPPSEATGQDDVATLLEKLASLREKGILTEEEFQKKKADLLSRM